MKATKLAIPDVVLLEPRVFGDERGFFLESYHEQSFDEIGLTDRFVQDNHSRSSQHVLRGLHYQIGKPQGKLVRVVHGTVYDVAVDLRRGTSTFGQWVGVELSAENRRMLWVPPGFAHGLLTLSETADFLYKCTAFYEPALERTIRWDDSALAIAWPIERSPLVSLRDGDAGSFASAEMCA